MRILIADDDPLPQGMAASLLSRWGHQVTSASDGQQAWSILQSEPAPELAILDWLMPGLNGLDVCRRLRAVNGPLYIYVILMTIKQGRADLLEGLVAGVDDYLVKPLDPPVLRARLAVGQRILELQSKLLAAREELQYRASRDFLTGLANRAAVMEVLEREVQRSRRQNTPVGVLLADLDHFKRINDQFGHAAGDLALTEAARRIASGVRAYDVVGRFGGEEFLIVLPGCDAPAAGEQARRILECVGREPLDLASQRIPISISIGAVSSSCYEIDAATLIRAADLALYQAKGAGRNRVQLYAGEIPALGRA